jgi:predicted kinase
MSERKPRLILINGQPGTGKTTIKNRLATDTALPTIGKDDYKEFLAEAFKLPAAPDWSATLGRIASVNLSGAAEVLLNGGYNAIVESAFIREYAYADMLAVRQNTGATALEIYCQTDPAVRRKRFADRPTQGNRHTIHTDTINQLSDAELAERYAPLALGETIYFDTTVFDDATYVRLVGQVKEFLKEGPHAKGD